MILHLEIAKIRKTKEISADGLKKTIEHTKRTKETSSFLNLCHFLCYFSLTNDKELILPGVCLKKSFFFQIYKQKQKYLNKRKGKQWDKVFRPQIINDTWYLHHVPFRSNALICFDQLYGRTFYCLFLFFFCFPETIS